MSTHFEVTDDRQSEMKECQEPTSRHRHNHDVGRGAGLFSASSVNTNSARSISRTLRAADEGADGGGGDEVRRGEGSTGGGGGGGGGEGQVCGEKGS